MNNKNDVTIAADFAHFLAAHACVMADRSPRLRDMTLYLIGRKIGPGRWGRRPGHRDWQDRRL